MNLNDGSVSPFVNDIPESEALKILIVTRGRSGSSFLGDLLNSYPGTFYTFEPLRKMETYVHGSKVIESIFKCKLPELSIDIEHNVRFNNMLKQKASRWKTSMEKLEKSKQVFYTSCKKFPIRLVKTIRLPFEDSKPSFGS